MSLWADNRGETITERPIQIHQFFPDTGRIRRNDYLAMTVFVIECICIGIGPNYWNAIVGPNKIIVNNPYDIITGFSAKINNFVEASH